MKGTLLQLVGVSVHYGGVKALDEASIEIGEGQIVALIGPNGAGKSTVIKSVFGLAPIQSGHILWHEKEIEPVSYKMVQQGVAYVPQGRQIFSNLTVQDNLEIGGVVIKDKKIMRSRIADVLDMFPDLKNKLSAKGRELSGGQQQMLALARGLITDPKVLMLDEPSLGLAPKIAKEVFEKIIEIKERRNTAILVVEHNIRPLLEVADRVFVLARGKVVIDEPNPKSLLEGARLERVFLGERIL
ncbi:MAG: ABC transporter ATP-binding protein [Candidatus Andersenbacteria bacterium]|nr:ABC transporter ATP-binding protein [Candidatus Andersenbacteria bacterium]